MANMDDGRKTYMHRKQSLFNQIDSDSSGQIDKNEFGKLYDLIKIEAEQELAKEAALEAKATKSARKTKMALCVAGVLLAFLGISVAANCAVVYLVTDTLKDTAVKDDAIMRTRTGAAVASGKLVNNLEMKDMPKKINGAIPVSFYNEIKMISFTHIHTGTLTGMKITGWKWFAESTMVLESGPDAAMLIHNENTFHVVAEGTIKWNGTGVATFNNASTAWEPTARAWCVANQCPSTDCVARTSEALGDGIYAMECDGVRRYKFSDDLHLEAKRRKLAAPLVFMAIRAAVVLCELGMAAAGPPGAAATAGQAVAMLAGAILM